MRQVKLSLRAAKLLLELLDGGTGIYGLPHEAAEQELRSATSRAERASATAKRLGAPKRAKRASKREETAAIRAAVEQRSKGKCEACGNAFLRFPEMDHQPGRGKAPQSVENCWLLCHWCHLGKTDNRPSASHWLGCFIRHCRTHGYLAEVKRANQRLAFVEARGGAR